MAAPLSPTSPSSPLSPASPPPPLSEHGEDAHDTTVRLQEEEEEDDEEDEEEGEGEGEEEGSEFLQQEARSWSALVCSAFPARTFDADPRGDRARFCAQRTQTALPETRECPFPAHACTRTNEPGAVDPVSTSVNAI